jgi:hypothetical protein
MPRYAGNCKTHGLVQHDALQKTYDLKGGAYCPLCGTLLELSTLKTWKKEKQKSK